MLTRWLTSTCVLQWEWEWKHLHLMLLLHCCEEVIGCKLFSVDAIWSHRVAAWSCHSVVDVMHDKSNHSCLQAHCCWQHGCHTSAVSWQQCGQLRVVILQLLERVKQSSAQQLQVSLFLKWVFSRLKDHLKCTHIYTMLFLTHTHWIVVVSCLYY